MRKRPPITEKQLKRAANRRARKKEKRIAKEVTEKLTGLRRVSFEWKNGDPMGEVIIKPRGWGMSHLNGVPYKHMGILIPTEGKKKMSVGKAKRKAEKQARKKENRIAREVADALLGKPKWESFMIEDEELAKQEKIRIREENAKHYRVKGILYIINT